jgi:hypothetical protein
MTIYLTPLGRVEVQQGGGQSLKNVMNHILTKKRWGDNEASYFIRNNWSKYGSPLFLNFHSISSKWARDVRVANIKYHFLNKNHSCK